MKTFAVFLFISLVLQHVVMLSAHEEAHKAKANIDVLSKKLHSNLLDLQDTYKLLSETKEEISKTIKELVIVRKLQVLLGQLTNAEVPSVQECEYEYVVLGFLYKQDILIETQSALSPDYTVSVKVNHKALVDEKKAAKNGEDLRVFYHPNKGSLPVEIDRIVHNLYTNVTTVMFRTQKMIPANTVDRKSYALVFGGKSKGKAKANPREVFAFYEDFSSSSLEGWNRVWGEWIVKNGSLFGKTERSPYGSGEVGLYLTQGKGWGDVEVELDLMETGSNVVYPGPFLRVQDHRVQHTTAWWFKYQTDSKNCTLRPVRNNVEGDGIYGCQLPEKLVKNKWFHFKYRLQGGKISQWANGQRIQDATVDPTWMIPKGTIGFGCHSIYSGSPTGCRTYYDNIKVQLMVPSSTEVYVSPGDVCHLGHKKYFKVGDKERPGDSCKHIHDASLRGGKKKSPLTNGVYWVKTTLQGHKIQTFCDMNKGGWTLVGKISGRVGDIYNSWLVHDVNTGLLRSPRMTPGRVEYGCLDARLIAVRHSTEIMLSSGENSSGVGKKWVRWELPQDREYGTWWKHGVGYERAKAAVENPVTVRAWNGGSKVCYQNKYGLMPHPYVGGSYPYASYNKHGNTIVNDYCMAVGVMLKGSTANGWSHNGNGYDSPQSDSDWPNTIYNHQQPYVLVWLK